MESGPRRFELLSEIGRGSFGEVYLAQMVSVGGFKKKVALKILREDIEGADDAARRLRDEARLLGRLRHPNIVQVDDLVRLEGRWAVLMEHIEGHDLVAILTALDPSGEVFPTVAALEVVAAIADALSAAYSGRSSDGTPLRVVHRDIKPSNVRLTERGEVKVLDFGIAWASFDDREAATGTVRFGSLPYMAPERLLSGVDLPEGDIYSLGCILYEMIVKTRLGRAPLTEHEHLAQKMQAQEAVRQLRPEARGVDALLGEMLAFHTEERPSAGRVARRARDLARAIHGEDLQSFARRYVPRIHHWVKTESRPASGVLSESSAAVSTLALGGENKRPWLLPVLTGLLGAAVAGTLMTLYVADLTAPQHTASSSAQAHPIEPPADEALAGADGATPALAGSDSAAPGDEPPRDAARPRQADTGADVKTAPSTNETENKTENTEATQEPATPPPTDEHHGPPERLRAVKISVPDAAALTATCGDRSSQGTTTVLLRGVPAGRCLIQATFGEQKYTADVAVYDAVGLSCALEAGVLVCS